MNVNTFADAGFRSRKRAPFALAMLLSLVSALNAGCERPRITGAQPDAALTAELRKTLSSTAEEASSETETAAEGGTGWATLTGTFRYAEGAAIPARSPLEVTKDLSVCKPGGAEVLSDSLEIDPATRGIKNVVLYLRKASREHESIAAPRPIEFDQKNCIFLSHVLAVRLGTTIDVKNSDPVAHNTNYSRSGMRGVSFNSTIPSGQSVAFEPTAEENQPVDVSCSIHPWMKAFILPRANGYFAVTAADGSFQIDNLPAGEDLEFQVWHESASGAAGALVADAPGVKWGKNGRVTLKLTENETVTLPVVVPASSFN